MAIERQESFGEIHLGRRVFAFPVRTLPLSKWPENARWSHYTCTNRWPGAQITNSVGDLGYNPFRGWPMNRSALFVLGLLLFSTDCFGQTTAGDSQTLQALLSEVR